MNCLLSSLLLVRWVQNKVEKPPPLRFRRLKKIRVFDPFFKKIDIFPFTQLSFFQKSLVGGRGMLKRTLLLMY
jgi:hypothetical protein